METRTGHASGVRFHVYLLPAQHLNRSRRAAWPRPCVQCVNKVASCTAHSTFTMSPSFTRGAARRLDSFADSGPITHILRLDSLCAEHSGKVLTPAVQNQIRQARVAPLLAANTAQAPSATARKPTLPAIQWTIVRCEATTNCGVACVQHTFESRTICDEDGRASHLA